MDSIHNLTKAALSFRDARDWKQFHKAKDLAISLMLEASELAEHFQWKDEAEVASHIEKSKEQIADELADVMYWVLVMSNDFGINLGEAFLNKMRKNEVKYPVEKSRGKHLKYNQL